MNVKNIKVVVTDRKEALKEFAHALGRAQKGETVQLHECISFQNINALRKILTEKRLELLHLIKKHHPDSLYQLAKIADRDLKSVNIDLDALKEMGFVSVQETEDGRHRVKPKVEFDTLQVEIAI